jgi:hypothetical protein
MRPDQNGGIFPFGFITDGGGVLGAGVGVYNVTLRNGTITGTASSPNFLGRSFAGVEFSNSSRLTLEVLQVNVTVTNFIISGMNIGVNSIIRPNILGDGLGTQCPSFVEGNVSVGGSTSSGSGCVFVNNIGL